MACLTTSLGMFVSKLSVFEIAMIASAFLGCMVQLQGVPGYALDGLFQTGVVRIPR